MNTSAMNDFISLSHLLTASDNVLIAFVCSVVNIVISLPTCVYILWLIVAGAGRSVASSEVFLVNLVITEALSCLGSIFIVITYISDVLFPSFIVFSCIFISLSRPVFHCCVCVERFLAVVYPVVFLRYKPLRYKVLCSAVIWAGVFGSSAGFTFLDHFTHVMNVHLCYVCVMFSIQLLCSVLILRSLRQTRPGEGDRNGEMSDTKLRAFKVVLIITVVSAITNLPLILLLVFHSLLSNSQLILGFFCYMVILVPTGLVQPLVFIHRAGKLSCIREC